MIDYRLLIVNKGGQKDICQTQTHTLMGLGLSLLGRRQAVINKEDFVKIVEK